MRVKPPHKADPPVPLCACVHACVHARMHVCMRERERNYHFTTDTESEEKNQFLNLNKMRQKNSQGAPLCSYKVTVTVESDDIR